MPYTRRRLIARAARVSGAALAASALPPAAAVARPGSPTIEVPPWPPLQLPDPPLREADYLAVADGIMRALRDRPTALERWPKGVRDGIKLATRTGEQHPHQVGERQHRLRSQRPAEARGEQRERRHPQDDHDRRRCQSGRRGTPAERNADRSEDGHLDGDDDQQRDDARDRAEARHDDGHARHERADDEQEQQAEHAAESAVARPTRAPVELPTGHLLHPPAAEFVAPGPEVAKQTPTRPEAR